MPHYQGGKYPDLQIWYKRETAQRQSKRISSANSLIPSATQCGAVATLITSCLGANMRHAQVNVLWRLKEKFSMATKHLGFALKCDSIHALRRDPACVLIQSEGKEGKKGTGHLFVFEATLRWSHNPPARRKQSWQHNYALSFISNPYYFATPFSNHRAAYIYSEDADFFAIRARKTTFTSCDIKSSERGKWRFYTNLSNCWLKCNERKWLKG